MNKPTKKNHFSPVFANKHWTNAKSNWKYIRYYRCPYQNKVIKREKGKRDWGYKYELYSQAVEDSFDKNLENEAAILYEKLIDGIMLNADERMKWGQYIIAQAVRTPCFFRYRDSAAYLTDKDYTYKENIVGTISNIDNKLIARRNWVILEAHERDYFVRTDNPVYMTGFLENPNTVVFYPLSPSKCFVACSMPELIPVLKGEAPPFPKQETLQLERGDTSYINFELVKSADESIIVAMKNDSDSINQLCIEVLGSYPQIPFLMQSASNEIEQHEKQERLMDLMSLTDEVEYQYREYPFTPFYGIEFAMGCNPFSVLEVINDKS